MKVKEKTTKEIILEQLQENTGRALCDSGGAYGRNFERNQRKTWEDFTANPVTLEAHVYKHGPKPELELNGTISVASWMENNLTYLPEMQAEYEAFCQRVDPDKDDYSMSLMEQFAKQCDPKGARNVVNTYNGECDLSQTLQWIEFEWTDADEFDHSAVLLQVHGGCDVRGGYTEPKAYEVREYGGLYNVTISGYGCDSRQWDEDGRDSNDYHAPRLEDYPVYEFEYESTLKQDLEALKQTDHDNQATRDLMTLTAKTMEREAQEEFWESLKELAPCISVEDRRAYYHDGEVSSEIYADCYALMG